MTDDPFNLARFVAAQAPVYAAARAELAAGRKAGHWMWFIFPQIAGLGHSETSRFYALRSIDEARAYLLHPMLGPRLRECVAAISASAGQSARDILGETDALKLRSSLTLFAAVSDGNDMFKDALMLFFDGIPDAPTLALLPC
jgi:uncharacterized protein (DUF1810 family)